MTVATIDRTDQPAAGANSISPVQTEWTSDQLAMLHASGVDSDTPTADLKVFLQQCQRTGLDPFARQVYLIGRWTKENYRDGNGRWQERKVKKHTIQTGIDGFRVIAHRSTLYAGQTDVEWCGPDGVWRNVWPESKAPTAARIGIRRHGFDAPLYAVAHFSEYAQTNRDGDPTGMWRNMPRLMISKVAEALALRKTFPQDLSGLYISEEMDQADGSSVYNISPNRSAGGDAYAKRRDHVEKSQSDAEDQASELEEYRAKVQSSLDKVRGNVSSLQTLHAWASDASRYDETAIQWIETAIHEAHAAAPQQSSQQADAADTPEVVEAEVVEAEVVQEPEKVATTTRPEGEVPMVGDYSVNEWERFVSDAERDADLETLEIHVQTLERAAGQNHRLTKIARVARNKIRNAQAQDQA